MSFDPSPKVQGVTPEDSQATENPVDVSGRQGDFYPGYHGEATTKKKVNVDPSGNMAVRGAFLTDEGSYRFNGSGSTFGLSIGSCTFTQNSNIVTGSGFLALQFLHIFEYVSIGTNGASPWYQVVSMTDTQIELDTPYLGTTVTATGYSCPIRPSNGAGATTSTSNGVFSIDAGTTAGSISEFERNVDILPLLKESAVKISQRIANQDIYIGLYDGLNESAPFYYAWFHFDGNINNVVKCETGFSRFSGPTANEIQTTLAVIPNPSGLNTYRVECIQDRVRFIINETLVAEHKFVIMRPQDLLYSAIRVVNGTTPTSSTLISVEYDSCSNYNKLAVGFADKETVQTASPNLEETLQRIAMALEGLNNPLTIDQTSSRLRVLLDATGGAQTLGTVTTVSTVTNMTSLNQIAAIQATSFIYDQMHLAWANAVRVAIT